MELVAKTKVMSEKPFKGRTGGLTPDGDLKTATEAGKTEKLPVVSGKGNLSKQMRMEM